MNNSTKKLMNNSSKDNSKEKIKKKIKILTQKNKEKIILDFKQNNELSFKIIKNLIMIINGNINVNTIGINSNNFIIDIVVNPVIFNELELQKIYLENKLQTIKIILIEPNILNRNNILKLLTKWKINNCIFENYEDFINLYFNCKNTNLKTIDELKNIKCESKNCFKHNSDCDNNIVIISNNCLKKSKKTTKINLKKFVNVYNEIGKIYLTNIKNLNSFIKKQNNIYNNYQDINNHANQANQSDQVNQSDIINLEFDSEIFMSYLLYPINEIIFINMITSFL